MPWDRLDLREIFKLIMLWIFFFFSWSLRNFAHSQKLETQDKLEYRKAAKQNARGTETENEPAKKCMSHSIEFINKRFSLFLLLATIFRRFIDTSSELVSWRIESQVPRRSCVQIIVVHFHLLIDGFRINSRRWIFSSPARRSHMLGDAVFFIRTMIDGTSAEWGETRWRENMQRHQTMISKPHSHVNARKYW